MSRLEELENSPIQDMVKEMLKTSIEFAKTQKGYDPAIKMYTRIDAEINRLTNEVTELKSTLQNIVTGRYYLEGQELCRNIAREVSGIPEQPCYHPNDALNMHRASGRVRCSACGEFADGC